MVDLLARAVSPDGKLTLLVERHWEADGPTIILGFDESGWHFHPTEAEASAIFDAVLADLVAIVEKHHADRTEFELMDDLEFELDGEADGTKYRFRLWSGPVRFEDLADGKVPYVPLSDLWKWHT